MCEVCKYGSIKYGSESTSQIENKIHYLFTDFEKKGGKV